MLTISIQLNYNKFTCYKFQPHLPDLPPPPAIGLTGNDVSSEALHTMLMSWYMTGYHTGYYQGLEAAKRKSN